MAYLRTRGLGEFIVAAGENWPKTIKYIERRPVTGKGVYNPWETEQQRRVWMAEQEAWPKIQTLMSEYRATEKRMQDNIYNYNVYVDQLNKVVGKPTGIGPISQYGGMATMVLPGYGWMAGAFIQIADMVANLINGPKKKKRINELRGMIEKVTKQLEVDQQRLQEIISELQGLLAVTQQASDVNAAIKQASQEILSKKVDEMPAALDRWAYIQSIRQNQTSMVSSSGDAL